MAGLAELEIVQLDEGNDGLVHIGQLYQGHFSILREKLEGLNVEADVGKGRPQIGLLHRGGNVGQVQRRRRRVDIGIVLAARLLEAVQVAVAIVFGEASVGLAVFWQLHRCVFRRHHANGLAPELGLVQVVHGQQGLLGLSHLHQGCVLLVEQNLHPLDVSVNPKKDEQVITFRQVFLQIRDQEDRPGATCPEGPVQPEIDTGDGSCRGRRGGGCGRTGCQVARGAAESKASLPERRSAGTYKIKPI